MFFFFKIKIGATLKIKLENVPLGVVFLVSEIDGAVCDTLTDVGGQLQLQRLMSL